MMFGALRVCRVPLAGVVRASVGSTVREPSSQLTCLVRSQAMSSQSRVSSLKRLKRPTLKERVMAPAGDGAFNVGRGFLAGASALGLGALCFYGIGLSNDVGAIDKAALWPDIVRNRIKSTYMYFGGSLAITAAAAVQLAKSQAVMRIVAGGGMMSLFGTMAAMIGTGMVVRALPYQEGSFGSKQVAWMVHSAVIGAVVAPLTFLGGALMVRAACYTAGVVGGLSTLAVCAPSEKFLNMGGPLAMGFGVVLASSVGTWFLPPTTALGAGMYSVAMYGGLVLFGMFLLYDTQKIIKRAETHPMYAAQPYDPINNSVSIYLDTINIFIRIAMIMAGGGRKK